MFSRFYYCISSLFHHAFYPFLFIFYALFANWETSVAIKEGNLEPKIVAWALKLDRPGLTLWICAANCDLGPQPVFLSVKWRHSYLQQDGSWEWKIKSARQPAEWLAHHDALGGWMMLLSLVCCYSELREQALPSLFNEGCGREGGIMTTNWKMFLTHLLEGIWASYQFLSQASSRGQKWSTINLVM